MTRPTKEQLEQAQAWLRENWSIAPTPSDLTDEGVERTVEMVAVLLAATAEPTDEELVQEVARAQVEYPGADDAYSFEQGYRAGACREGAR